MKVILTEEDIYKLANNEQVIKVIEGKDIIIDTSIEGYNALFDNH